MVVETIAARATPPGAGGVGIIRVSGPRALAIAKQITSKDLVVKKVNYANFYDNSGAIIDQGIALLFRAPSSFTGEDVLELHGHGGVVVLDMLLSRCLELGARLARPGEFSERAFLNNKIDLAQAESVAELIAAGSRQAARAALRSMQGVFSEQVTALTAEIIELRVLVEAAIDFPEEEIDFLSDPAIAKKLMLILQRAETLLGEANCGALLSSGVQTVIVGPPNVGKSTLLNALCREEVAIVTEQPGTTRDIVERQITVGGVVLNILDTAGVRETDDLIEVEGIKKTWQAIESTALAIVVLEEGNDNEVEIPLPPDVKKIIVFNKIDKKNTVPALCENNAGQLQVLLSAKTKAGLPLLKTAIKRVLNITDHSETTFLARKRHIKNLSAAIRHLQHARLQLEDNAAGELLAEELRLAQNCLSKITGEYTSDDLLGEIFANFCVGK